MGCSSSKQIPGSSPADRMRQYQIESQSHMKDLRLQPNNLDPENFRDGYISVNRFYNHFHDGFCGPYIANPKYMLVIDFRTYEEYLQCHVMTALHHKEFKWSSNDYEDLRKYSIIVFYDHDGTLAANILSTMNLAFRILTNAQIEVSCILGGIQSVARRFPHLIDLSKGKGYNMEHHPQRRSSVSSTFSVSSETSGSLASSVPSLKDVREKSHFIVQINPRLPANFPWMPTLVLGRSLFLGRREQAEDQRVIKGLGITHVVSIGRCPDCKNQGTVYFGVDGEKNLYLTFLSACEFIQTALEKGGKVLVHGIDGLNRSAAVVLAYAMSSVICTMEEAVFYLQVLRPHLHLDNESIISLLRWENSIFGNQVSEVKEMWL